MTEVILRPYQPEDFLDVVTLFTETIHQVNAAHYTPQQLAAWAPVPPDLERLRPRLAQAAPLLAEIEGQLAGFATFRAPDYLDLIYTHHRFLRRGVATRLLREIETRARQAGVSRLRADSSITARPFFEAAGFRLIAQQEVILNGVPLINFKMEKDLAPYRGRLAPSPTGFLHLGHARTFWTAQERARAAGGILVLRDEDLDAARCRPEFVLAMLEDLHWFGLSWQEGPDVGGPCSPYQQSRRLDFYRSIFTRLQDRNVIYPCTCSRQDVQRSAQAPHAADEEPVYPGTCRTRTPDKSARTSWRFRVPDGQEISFHDRNLGPQKFVAGQDFGDFIIWRHDDVPAYQLAVVADDAAMGITEVVRGADLLVSTARQLLLYRALDMAPPAFFHCPLLADERGTRLAKRHDALSLRRLRAEGHQPAALREKFLQASSHASTP